MRPRVLAAGSLLASMSIGLLPSPDSSLAFAHSLPPVEMPESTAQQQVGTARSLQLEVFINGRPTDLIAQFRQEPDGSLAIAPDQLRNVGIDPAEQAVTSEGLVAISRLSDVSYKFDETAQEIHFTVGYDAISTRVIEAHKTDSEVPSAQSGVGGLVNYTIYASTGGDGIDDMWGFEGVSGWFEGRVFSPLGVLSHSQIVSSSPDEAYDSTRLDTTWSYSNPGSMITYRAGDIITGGLSWTRPTRLGGVQVQRNFGLRPDLVTMPLPELSGSAAVPSTVDVYVNNARRLSQQVSPGPFEITNLPVVTGSGTARVVVRDALGREIVTETPYFASSALLAPGLWDFSAEGGFARRFYGLESNDYDSRFMASGTVRYGLGDWLTLEAHAEGGGGLLNGGAGAVFGIGDYGVGSFAAAASAYDGRTGHQIAGSVELQLWDLNLYGRMQRTFGDYLDIAAVTAAPLSSSWPDFDIFSAAPPRSLDQVSLSVPLKFDPLTFNISYTQFESFDGDESRILGLSFSRPIGSRASLFATAYKDFENDDSFGAFAGLSMTFGGDIHASVGTSSDSEGTTVTTDLIKSDGNEIGSVGWRIRDAEGARTNRLASVRYRAPIAQFEVGVEQYEDLYRAMAQVDGAVVLAGGGVFLSNRVNDAFAVVDTGAPGVEVEYENRPVGRTNRSGKLLLSDLRSHEPNKITIDPTNLPVDATVNGTKETTVPADRSGTVVKFDVDSSPQAALVTLRDEEGRFAETGATGHLSGSSESFVVGYDGQAYVTGLGQQNTVIIDQPSRGRCEATFTFQPRQGEQVAIPGAVCRKVQ
ncbi:fimbria/pilus outer membrane usher protein [Chelativorans sp. YIM 93263]|uniref:fimbria/pilus outer membrane usher protein n=1 Tax=Chelativorans sp. YIM 93263 TaxID=2906648 RepID=UPI0023794BF5|nr:fimbria/pilus outer membrane usher protein [Chelativorans sp. YIM 93263]